MVRLADVSEPERSYIAELDCLDYSDTPPVTPPAPARRHVAIVSSAGFIVRGERPMLSNETGYRSIAADVADGDILCSHVSTNFDRTGFLQDWNVVFPIDRLRELSEEGVIGSVADYHYSFMGATDPAQMERDARTLAGVLKKDKVDAVFLVPV